MTESLVRDLRFAVRLLASRPGWTAAAILCLAIATGANTAAFTLVNGLLLRPLPFDRPEQLVMVAMREAKRTSVRPFALREYWDLAEQSRSVGTLFARTFFPVSLVADDGARMAQAEVVSGNYFDGLHVTPFLGRFFSEDADRATGAAVTVLSHRLWRVRFAENPAVIGTFIRINGRPVVISGIGPPEFVGATQLVAADLWIPTSMYGELAGSPGAETVPMFGVMGRLWDNVTVREAEMRLSSVVASFPRSSEMDTPPAVVVTAATGFGVPVAMQGAVLTLSGFVYVVMALLMAVACANVAALVLARGTARTREIAIRLSLGASRRQIAQQLLTETCVLALIGCGLGTIIALWMTQALIAQLVTPFQYVSYAIDVRPDARVLAYSAIATCLAAALSGIVPIRHSARVDLLSVANRSAANLRGGSNRTLNAIVVLQFAVSAILLAIAGMLVSAYQKAELARPGFETHDVLATTLDLNQIHLDKAAGVRLYRDLTDRLSRLPGVAHVSLTRDLPLMGGRTALVTADQDSGTQQREPIATAAMLVSPGYFETLGIAVRQGRGFSDTESSRPLIAIVNETMAQRLWPGTSPIGRTFRISAQNDEPIEVVGIVPDMRERSFSEVAQPTWYQPFTQAYSAQMAILIRVHGDAEALVRQVRETVRAVNHDLAIMDLRTLDQFVDGLVAQRRIPATMLVLTGLLGLLLTALGLYGVMAYGVRERAREMGIRLALGARPSDIRRMVLRQGLTITGIGLASGGAGILVVTRIVQRTLFGVDPLRASTLVEVSAVLTVTALVALYLPARWASGIAPAQTLRSE